MKGKRSLFLTLLALVVILGLSGLVQGQGRRFKSPGERIYYTGIGVMDIPFPFTGVPCG